ncbi:MAG: DUF2511 domain-containing protein [Myxococcota bacterium]
MAKKLSTTAQIAGGLAVAVVVILGIQAFEGPDNSVSAAEFGDDWPFAADSGTVHCENVATGRKAYITVAGQDFALNGTAAASMTEVWQAADALKPELFAELAPGLKVPTPTALTQKAIALCD